jgi:pyruvate/2-oxoglutarate dehydrogenase complex dihydrolipoamide dehydrogenase (E3) component
MKRRLCLITGLLAAGDRPGTALKSIPSSMVVVGAGVIGVEYASMFAALGTKATIVEKRETMLDLCDPEIVEALRFHLSDWRSRSRSAET